MVKIQMMLSGCALVVMGSAWAQDFNPNLDAAIVHIPPVLQSTPTPPLRAELRANSRRAIMQMGSPTGRWRDSPIKPHCSQQLATGSKGLRATGACLII